MIPDRPGRDDGQTIPLYLVAGVGLLFVALAFFAVGQAEDSRSSTQTAADAAALAAAKSARDEVRGDFLAALTSGDLSALPGLLDPQAADSADCAAARDYASRNGAEVTGCDPVAAPPGYQVEVRSVKSIGRSVVKGTDAKHAKASATAVIEPRCRLATDQPGGGPKGTSGGGAASSGGKSSGGKSGGGSDSGGSGGGGSGSGGGSGGPVAFTCDGGHREVVDPDAPGFDLDLGDFFSIRLTH